MKPKTAALIPVQAKSAALAIWQCALEDGLDPAAVMAAVIEEAGLILAAHQARADRIEAKEAAR